MTALRLCAVALVTLWCSAAQAAGEVVVYSANEQVLDTLVFDAFEKESGLKVQPVSAGSGVLFKRIQTEKDRPQGDIIWGVSRSLLEQGRPYFTAYRSKNRDAIPAEYRDPDDLWIGNNLHLLVILQNTKIMPEAQGPKSWADLLDRKWQGKIAFTDPNNSGSAFTNTTLLAEMWGWDKVETLYANTKVLSKSSLVFQGVGTGEYGLGLSLEYAGYVWASNGAPVKVIYPADGTVAQMEGVAIIKGGPNLEGAKAFVDFINRKDVRELIFQKTFRRPARQDLDFSKLPGNMPPLAAVKLAPYDEKGWSQKRTETLQKIQDIVEKTR
jgi:iron(III) transport system substrate-binding protein